MNPFIFGNGFILIMVTVDPQPNARHLRPHVLMSKLQSDFSSCAPHDCDPDLVHPTLLSVLFFNTTLSLRTGKLHLWTDEIAPCSRRECSQFVNECHLQMRGFSREHERPRVMNVVLKACR